MDKVAIINRSFWPDSYVIGKALYDLSLDLSANSEVVVITQSNANLDSLYDNCKNIELCKGRSLSSSSSKIVSRLSDAFYFFFFVLISLLKKRPNKVYVSTNPPVIVPFISSVYCRLFGAELFYHVQDIHPEIANIIYPVNKLIYKILIFMDSYTLSKASKVITLTDSMKLSLASRGADTKKIILLNNPGFDVASKNVEKTDDVVFCGNLGRLQYIPLLVEAIKTYRERGGSCKFTFIGSGIHSADVDDLSKSVQGVTYLGRLGPDKSSEIVSRHKWALLPIDERVDNYAFPSKTSSYIMSKCNIIGICGDDTEVSAWLKTNEFGLSSDKNVDDIVQMLFRTEKFNGKAITDDVLDKFSIQSHVNYLKNIIL